VGIDDHAAVKPRREGTTKTAMGQTAVIFPGQGAQSVGMGRDVASASAKARGVYDRANQVLGFDIAKVCFEGPAEKLEQTDVQQPAIFVTGVAIFQDYLEAGGALSDFQWAGGLSLGEYTALHVAGVIGFEDALRLVQRRGQLMQEAAAARPSGMVSLVGADREKAEAICEKARGDDVLTPANFNCPGQIVVAGTKAACQRAIHVADALGCRAVPLAVAGAFHSEIMRPAADGLRLMLEKTPINPPKIPVISNVDANYHGDAVSIRASLVRQLTQPVLWQQCVERMAADGAERFVEFGPGRILTGLMRKINRGLVAENISTAQSVVESRN
jgi:[acyl-carrier-protein] S-malonyltransferase